MTTPLDQSWLPTPDFSVTPDLIDKAAKLVDKEGLVRTRLVECPPLSARYGRPVHLKCENEQRTGSFKVRGALTRLAALDKDQRAHGVVTSSAGNHGLGVAWACRLLGIPGLVVVPEGVAQVKLDKLRTMLIKIRLHGANYDETEAYAVDLARTAEATFVSPFDDPWVMAGNGGTVGREILAQLPDCSAVVTPVGGGGLASGLGAALGGGVALVGVNSEASPAMARSLAERQVLLRYDAAPTLAEGLEGGVTNNSVGLCGRALAAMEVVSEASIAEAIRFVVRQHKMVLEGSAAVGVAALLEDKPIPGDGPICVVLTGRNIDHARLRQILEG